MNRKLFCELLQPIIRDLAIGLSPNLLCSGMTSFWRIVTISSQRSSPLMLPKRIIMSCTIWLYRNLDTHVTQRSEILATSDPTKGDGIAEVCLVNLTSI